MAVDFRNIFDDVNRGIYFDNAHVGYKNNEIIAEKIFNLIQPVIENKFIN
jgi:hypothetical protein